MKLQKAGFVITIDGPAGSGKSTVSGELARRLNFNFLTTGAFYRGLAILCGLKNADIDNPDSVAKLAGYKNFIIRADVNGTKVIIDEVDVTEQLASEETARVASRISAYGPVRKALLEPQRAFNRPPGLVAEGRDCGTVVFPQAQVKIFLTANLDTRAQRRLNEDKSASSEKLAHRDQADTVRKVAPMAKAEDAVLIDTSTLTIDEVVEKIERIVALKVKGGL